MADDDWKKRIGIEINYNSSEEEDRQSNSDESSASPLSPLGYNDSSGGIDAILRDYEQLGRTPPRTRILRRNRDRSRKEKEQSTTKRIVYAGRNSHEKNMYNRQHVDHQALDDDDNQIEESRRTSYTNKRNMQRLRGSERDLKLDLSDIHINPSINKEDRAESLPQPAIKVETCNRFMSLTSKLVACKNIAFPAKPQFSATTEECPKSRIEFYQTFSSLIKMGNAEKQGDMTNCRRQLSREEHLWQNELKDLIWLELQAWHADRTPTEQDKYLCEARESVQQLLLDIINYRFVKKADQMSTSSNDSGIQLGDTPLIDEKEDDPCNCATMFCPMCLEQQNTALHEVGSLLSRLEEAEALYPSSKAFAVQYPLYLSDQFIARVKAMCLWYNMTKHHRLKLVILGKQLYAHCLTTYLNPKPPRRNSSYSDESSKNFGPLPLDSPNSSVEDDNTPSLLSVDLYNTQPIAKIARYLKHIETSENLSSYRKYIEDVLKTKGLRKALAFLEKLHFSVLYRAGLTLEKPCNTQTEETQVKPPDETESKSEPNSPDETELRRYGYWSPESQALNLPSYRAAYLFLCRIPLDLIHEFLRLRLETKPERPSSMSIRQLIRELKEGLHLAVLHRQRYILSMKTALWNVDASISAKFAAHVAQFDETVQSFLEVYLDYLQQWVQMIQQERVQKNILKEEWAFVTTITPHIPGGQALVGSSFCRLAVSMLRALKEQFKSGVEYFIKKRVEKCDGRCEEDVLTKQAIFTMCRELQMLCSETREKAFNVVMLSKTLRKDLEIMISEGNISSLCCNVIADSLVQLKREAMNMCECLSSVVELVENATKVSDDLEYDCDRSALLTRTREVLHQLYKFGFEYHKEVCWLATGVCRAQVARKLISFAQHWMLFVKHRCERGRGLRPRWANNGLDFLMTVCEHHFTSCLTDEEFEQLKSNIDECISHVIGTAVPNSSGGSSTPPANYYSKTRCASPSPSSRTPKTSTSSLKYDRGLSVPPVSPEISDGKSDLTDGSLDKDSGNIVETLVCPSRRLSRSDRVLCAVTKLDETLDSQLRENELIGSVCDVSSSHERNYIRPRAVNFSWQRGIKIGQGRFGKVYTAVNNETGELMAMKEIALQPNDHRTIKNVAVELKIFEGIHHENLVRYYGVEIHREEMLIFMELCTEGTLESLVAATETGLPEALCRRYTLQLVKAVSTLHKHSIVHRDIKTANIFLTAEGNCLKLGDFGSAVKIMAHTTVPGELQGFVGTQAYMAPEVFMKSNTEGHGRAVDIWSLGCVLVEMASGKRPWAEFDSNYQIMFKVGMGEIPDIPDNLSEEGRHFASICLVHDPKLRATTNQLLLHTFLRVDEDECVSYSMPSVLEDYLKLGIKR